MGTLATPELTQLAEGINEAHDAATGAAKTAIEHAKRCGQLLLEAKGKLAHGEWLPWLKENCRVGERQARRYMWVAENWERIGKTDSESDLTIAEAARLTEEANSERRMPALSDTHTLRCLGEDDTLAIVVPMGGRYYYVGVVHDLSEDDCTIEECARGIIDYGVERMLFDSAKFQPVGEWDKRPLSGDDLRFVMEAKDHYRKTRLTK